MNDIRGICWSRFDLITELLLSSKWIFAKTMPENPHWYTLKKDWQFEHRVPWEQVVLFLREHSYPEMFYTKEMRRFNINQFKYWSMGAPLDKTILINRAMIEEPTNYDVIAGSYDAVHSNADAILENIKLMELIYGSWDNKQEGTVLDVGCGTGLFLDHINIAPEFYRGVDPSHKMLDQLKAKHSKHVVMKSRFEEYSTINKFDLIVCLFGSAAYIDKRALERIPSMLEEGGRYVVMAYREGYIPITDRLLGVEIPRFDHRGEVLKGEITEFGNFLIMQGGKND